MMCTVRIAQRCWNGFSINVNDCSGQNGGSNEEYNNDNDYKSYNFSLKMFVTYNYVMNMIKDNNHENNKVNKLFNKWFIK